MRRLADASNVEDELNSHSQVGGTRVPSEHVFTPRGAAVLTFRRRVPKLEAMSQPLFHLSIPATDLEVTKRWYVEGLGCAVGRCSDHALILDLGGHQLVAQKQAQANAEPAQTGIYPRHFGLVFSELASWRALSDRARAAGLSFAVEPKLRFAGEVTEHHTFFLIDPSGNWLEFKHYTHPEAVLGCQSFATVGEDSQRVAL